MTDEEFEANLASTAMEAHRINELVDSTLSNDALVLCREVRRLRGLIKLAESSAGKYVPYDNASDGHCPWCGYWSRDDIKRRHAPECDAFTEGGQVR